MQLPKGAVLAPMAGVTDSPFRKLCRELGAALVYSECISAEGIRRGSRASWELCRFEETERPIGIQLFGSEKGPIAEAAALVAQKFSPDFIDINCGCPVKRFVTKGYGGWLMRDPDKIGKIVEAVREASGLPVTVKLRAGYKHPELTAHYAAQAAEDAGASWVAVHARFVHSSQDKPADWNVIAQVKKALRKIPVIGNGDLRSYKDIHKMLNSTGCDSVMIARWAQGAPWIFSPLKNGNPPHEEVPDLHPSIRLGYLIKHLNYAKAFYGEARAVIVMRKHCLWYISRFPGAAVLRNEVMKINQFNDLVIKIHHWKEHLKKIPAYDTSQEFMMTYHNLTLQ